MNRLLTRTARAATVLATAGLLLVGGAATATAATAEPAAPMAMSTFAGSTATRTANVVVLDGVQHRLVGSETPRSGFVRQVYLPAGQRLSGYTRMVLVEAATGPSVADAVRAQTDMLQRRKATDPLVNMDVRRSGRGGEAILDFTMSGRTDDGREFVEWNAYRYVPIVHNGERGVQLFGLSLRAYDTDRLGFARNLKQTRTELIPALGAARVPRITTPLW